MREPGGIFFPPVTSAPAPMIERAPISAPSRTIGIHADEDFIGDGAGVQDGFVADGDEFADKRGEVVGEMNDAAILDVRARADDDAIDVRPEDRLEPHARLFPKRHIADDRRIRRDEGRGVNLRFCGEIAVHALLEIHFRSIGPEKARINREG